MRMKNKKLLFGIIGVVLVLSRFLPAQTNHWTLKWNNNNEDDMYLYRVFKGTSPQTLAQIDSVYYPDSTYQDYQIEKGEIYYYALKAVDFSLNASPFSDLISGAIPKISNFPAQLELPSDTSVVFALDDYVNDPDHQDQQLQWTASGYNQLQVSINPTTRRALIQTPSNWNGSERINFKVNDPNGFYDVASVLITSRYAEQPPVFATIPKQETKEDTPIDIVLSQYVRDADTPKDSLKFSAKQPDHLTLQVKDSILKVIPEKNWYGEQDIRIYVHDQTGLTDSAQFKLVVLAVNDPPILNKLPNVRMNQDTTVIIDLNPYVYDVDNSKQDMTWEFSNHPHLTLDYSKKDQKLTLKSPSDWFGFEYIVSKVTDPSGAFDTDTLVVQVIRVTYAPQISSIPEIRFNEDESTDLELNDYVNDQDTPLPNLFWEVKGNDFVHVSIDYEQKRVTFSSKADWFGSEQFWLKVTDPDQYSDSTLITVTVLPVNDPPVFKNFPVVDLSATNPRSIPFKNYVQDIDNDAGSLYLRVLSSDSVQITIGEDKVEFRAGENWYGSEKDRLIVQDPAGASDTTEVLVYRQNLETAPKIIDLDTLHIAEDQQKNLELNSRVSDPDNSDEEISWTIFPSQNIAVQFDAVAKNVTLKPYPDWFGEENIVFKATDPQGNFDFDTLQVFVLPVNDPPVLKPIEDYTMLAGTYFTLDLRDYLYDADGYEDLASIELFNDPHSFIGYYLTDNGLRATFFAPRGFHGKETFMIRATDRAGAQAVTIFVVQVIASSLASAVQVHPFGSGDVIYMDWKTRMPTMDRLEYSLDWSFDQSTPTEQSFNTAHHFVLKNLQPNKTYNYRVVSLDENGNVIYNPDSSFETGSIVTGVNVFPIPFRVNDPASGDGIYFTNMKEDATIYIYNLLGEPVFKKEKAGPIFMWDLKNDHGRMVHSGVYLYLVDNSGKKTRGKLIIIR